MSLTLYDRPAHCLAPADSRGNRRSAARPRDDNLNYLIANFSDCSQSGVTVKALETSLVFPLTLGWADKGSSTWWGGERDEGGGGRKGCTASLTELCGVNTQTLLLGSPASHREQERL